MLGDTLKEFQAPAAEMRKNTYCLASSPVREKVTVETPCWRLSSPKGMWQKAGHQKWDTLHHCEEAWWQHHAVEMLPCRIIFFSLQEDCSLGEDSSSSKTMIWSSTATATQKWFKDDKRSVVAESRTRPRLYRDNLWLDVSSLTRRN